MTPTQPDGPEPKSRKGRGNKSPKAQDAKGKVKIAAYVSLEVGASGSEFTPR